MIPFLIYFQLDVTFLLVALDRILFLYLRDSTSIMDIKP